MGVKRYYLKVKIKKKLDRWKEASYLEKIGLYLPIDNVKNNSNYKGTKAQRHKGTKAQRHKVDLNLCAWVSKNNKDTLPNINTQI